MKTVTTFLILLLATTIYSQKENNYNLGFEQQTDESALSDNWVNFGGSEVSIVKEAQAGAKAGKIISDGTEAFGCISLKVPAQFRGEKITLVGYMKTKNVTDGFAGLVLRLDSNGEPIEFDNMQDSNIQGTTDWTKYTITLDYHKEVETIFVMGLLVGKGEVWFDNFHVSIDGKNLQTLNFDESLSSPAKKDTEFNEGSLITLSDLDESAVKNLELLGRVWGFMKYHHPEIAKGNYNWDYELFRFLPKYQAVESPDQGEALLVDWIKSFGELPEVVIEPVENEIIKSPDHAWIKELGNTLQSTLMYVYERRNQGEHYYIALHESIGNPDFKNENSYAKMSYPDDGFRLLSLFRYWNMIHYFFPNTHLMDKDWNTVLQEYIPIFIDAEDELAYEKAAIRLIGEIQDTHASLGKGSDQLQLSRGSFFSTIKVKFIENQLVVIGFYDIENTTDLKIGDVITKVHGKSVMAWVRENAPYYPASNRPTMLRNMTRDLLRYSEDKMSIEFYSENSKSKIIDLPLYASADLGMYRRSDASETPSFKMLKNNIGYVTLATITQEEVEALKKQFQRTDGIIIDIRNYPNTFVPFSLGSYFVSEKTPFVKFTQGNINNPGEMQLAEPLDIPSEGKTYKGKLIVLVNEETQSQAEYTSMAFRASKNTTIVGSTTAGADGNVSSIVLPGGLGTMISGIGVLYPDGTETQRVGIVPDIEIKPTIKGITEGRDELMEKAIEIILEE